MLVHCIFPILHVDVHAELYVTNFLPLFLNWISDGSDWQALSKDAPSFDGDR
jgi:hypothetical protein